MILLIHGTDITASRRMLNEEKEKRKNTEVVSFEGSKLNMDQLTLALEAHSLFSEKKTIIIESLLTGQITKEKQALLQSIAAHGEEADIIIWENKEIEKTTLKKFFSKAREINHALPKILFSFLDSIGIAPPGQVLTKFHELLKDQDAELIFAMIARQIRLLIIAGDLGIKGFPGMQSWQTDKLLRQAQKFPPEKLISAYRQLLSIDARIKYGQTPYPMAKLLDIWLVTTL